MIKFLHKLIWEQGTFKVNFNIECKKSLRKRGRWRFTKGKMYQATEVFQEVNGDVFVSVICNEGQNFTFALLTDDNFSYRFYDTF